MGSHKTTCLTKSVNLIALTTFELDCFPKNIPGEKKKKGGEGRGEKGLHHFKHRNTCKHKTYK